jgi:hypothetical protein
MKLGTANIKNYPDMPEKKVIADAREVSSYTDIWGMQENNPAEDDEAIRPELGKDWGLVGGNTDLPIWYRKDVYRNLDFDVLNMGWAGRELALTPKPRLAVAGTFELLDRAGIDSFVVVNLHFIAGGYNGPRTPPRRSQWDHEWAKVCDFIKSYMKKGKTTFVVGDFNHPRPPKPVGRFQWLVGERLDRIGVTLTGPIDVDEKEDGVIMLNSDHNAQWTRVTLSKRSN